MTLPTTEAVERFLSSLRARSVPISTIKAYRLDLQQFLRAAPEVLAEVTVDTICAFLDGNAQHAPATRRRHAATLRAFYRWLVQQDLITVNPMQRLTPIGQIEREPRPLKPEEVTRIFKAIPSSNVRDRALFTLLYETGMRVGDYIG